MLETPKQIKERVKQEQEQQIYGALIFLIWVSIVLLLQTFVPGAALFIKQTWWIFGAAGMLLMMYFVLKQGATKSDIVVVPFIVLTGPVGIMFVLTWIGLVKIQRKRTSNGKRTQSAQRS